MTQKAMKLSPMAFGLSLGVAWGASLFFVGILAHYMQFGVSFVKSVGTVYLGYDNTIIGSFMGAGWGLLDAFMGGAIIAWLYNCFCKALGNM